MDLNTRCKKCNQPIEFGNMRALPEGEGFICRNCLDNTSDNLNSKAKRDVTQIDLDKNFFDKRAFQCRACGYNFSRSASIVIKACPYCGKENLEEKHD